MLMKVIRNLLQQVIDNIDAGNSDLTEQECFDVIKILQDYTAKDAPLTKYQAANYLHVSRATFDNLVANGKIPSGKKLYQGDSNIFWYKKDLNKYLKNK